MHPELKPDRNDKKENQKIVATVQQDQESKSEDDEKITIAGFTGGGPIDLESELGDEMNIASLGLQWMDPLTWVLIQVMRQRFKKLLCQK